MLVGIYFSSIGTYVYTGRSIRIPKLHFKTKEICEKGGGEEWTEKESFLICPLPNTRRMFDFNADKRN